MRISIYRAIGAPGNGKYVVDVINSSNKRYLREQMNRLTNNITTTFEGIGILHSASIRSTISFEDTCKYLLIEASCVAGKIIHQKIKNAGK